MKVTRATRRSVLSAPGDRWDLLVKQQAAPSDVVMIDLEHAVHPDRKADARYNAVRALKTLMHVADERIVRVNDPRSEAFDSDIRLLAETPPDCYLVPKVLDADDAARAVARIEQIEADFPGHRRPGLWFLIESPGAVLQAEAIAKNERTEALLLGHGDLEHGVGFVNQGWSCSPPLDFARSMLVFAAAAAGIDAIDGAITGYSDPTQVEQQARHSSGMGMAGVLIVSPRQIEPVHKGFRPAESDIERARQIVAAFATVWKEGNGVAVVDGHFVDDVLALHAQDTLRRAGVATEAFDIASCPQSGGAR